MYIVSIEYLGKTLKGRYSDLEIALKAVNELMVAYSKRNNPCKVTIENVEEN
jgi:hypothetical protein